MYSNQEKDITVSTEIHTSVSSLLEKANIPSKITTFAP